MKIANQCVTGGFFGRRCGRSLRPVQRSLLNKLLPPLRLDLLQRAPDNLTSLFQAKVTNVQLEIGFGSGEHLLYEAGRFPETGFIGVEPFINGMATLLTQFDAQPLANLRLYDNDATQVCDWLPSASLDGIDLFYPDPWPKKRHWKRRFVNEYNLNRFARVLKPGGWFRFASDSDPYVNWTLLHCRKHESFQWQVGSPMDWHQPCEGWVRTRYEIKAFREGRKPAYLSFVRL